MSYTHAVLGLLEKIEKDIMRICREIEIDIQTCSTLLSPVRLRKQRLLEITAEAIEKELFY